MTKRRRKPHPSTLSVECIETRSIVIKDEAGRDRIRLRYSPGTDVDDGTSLIQMYNNQGRIQLELILSEEGAFIQLGNKSGSSMGITMGIGVSGTGVTVNDERGIPTISLGAPASNNPGEVLYVLDKRKGRGWSPFCGEYKFDVDIKPQNDHPDDDDKSTS